MFLLHDNLEGNALFIQLHSILKSSRNAERSEEHFERCLQSLEEEIMFNACNLLAVEEPPPEVVDEPKSPKHYLKKKPGRSFRHALSALYIHDSGRYMGQFFLMDMNTASPIQPATLRFYLRCADSGKLAVWLAM